MKASKLRQRLVLQSQTETVSNTGSITNEWINSNPIYCSFEPLSVKDMLSAQSVNSKAIARAVIRYKEGIDSSMQVLYKDKVYQIEGNPLADSNSGIEYLTLLLSIIE